MQTAPGRYVCPGCCAPIRSELHDTWIGITVRIPGLLLRGRLGEVGGGWVERGGLQDYHFFLYVKVFSDGIYFYFAYAYVRVCVCWGAGYFSNKHLKWNQEFGIEVVCLYNLALSLIKKSFSFGNGIIFWSKEPLLILLLCLPLPPVFKSYLPAVTQEARLVPNWRQKYSMLQQTRHLDCLLMLLKCHLIKSHLSFVRRRINFFPIRTCKESVFSD